MYLSIGSDMAVRERAVIGIFDLDNTSYDKRTRAFLKRAEQEGAVVAVTDELPRAFVLTSEFGMERVYLTSLSSRALGQRAERNAGL